MQASVCEFKVWLVYLASSGRLGLLNETLSLIFFKSRLNQVLRGVCFLVADGSSCT